jgi:cysteine desulfurase
MIYADFNGSSRMHPDVTTYLDTRLKDGLFGNPNSIHSVGRKIKFGIEKCRKVIADIIGCSQNQIIFNSGASEGISHIFHSVLSQSNNKTIIISAIEHSAVNQAAEYFRTKGFNLVIAPVDDNGVLKLDSLETLLTTHKNDIALVSIMAANNETGVIQPYKEVGMLCQKYKCIYFSDTTQFIAKADFSFEDSLMDYAVISSHKVGGIIGSGALIAKDPTSLIPLVFGGGQESGKRGGTQNYIGIECMAVAMDSFNTHKGNLEECKARRSEFEAAIQKAYPEVVVIGQATDRLASTTLIAYPGVHGQAVQIELESNDIFVTTSSACSDNEPSTSKVLKAMNTNDEVGRSVVRISLCLGKNDQCYKEIKIALLEAYAKLTQLSSFKRSNAI